MLARAQVSALLVFAASPRSVAGGALSVTGAPLATCSKPGKALTGFTRDGHCEDQGDDDAGSHHICIQMKPDFCTVTGQPNWCGEDMTCMGQEGLCPIGNWCVCQWAFATYIKLAGGCDAIVDLVCDATNMAALKAYKAQAAGDAHIATALQCLQTKCNLPQTSRLNDASVPRITPVLSQGFAPALAVVATMSVTVFFLGAALRRWRRTDTGDAGDAGDAAASDFEQALVE